MPWPRSMRSNSSSYGSYSSMLPLLLLLCLAKALVSVNAQILSASFTPCLQNAAQAPSNQLLNISRVYAQLDVSDGSSNASADAASSKQGLLRLVALADTGVEAEGFSNETNYLATLIVETSMLSFIPYTNQSSLCSSILTAGQATLSNNLTASDFPSPGGCPYGPGSVMVGYQVPLGMIGPDDEIYPLSTLSTRLRILDTSYPPLQLACVDIATTPYFYDNVSSDATTKSVSSRIYDLVQWLPVAIFVTYVLINVVARAYAAVTLTRTEREAAMASSLTTRITAPTFVERCKETLLETVIGRSIIRSRNLTRFVTPGVGDVLAFLQWVAIVGMCSVRWQGFAYPLFSRVAWSMLLFNTTIVTPSAQHTTPSLGSITFPPSSFMLNNGDLFTTASSPFYMNLELATSSLLNLPATALYNDTRSTRADVYTSTDELDGLVSFAAMVGLRPQALFSNSMTFFAILLAVTALFTLLIPALVLSILRSSSGISRHSTSDPVARQSASFIGGADESVTALDLTRNRFNSLTSGRASPFSGSSKARWSDGQTPSSYKMQQGSSSGGQLQSPTSPGRRHQQSHGGIHQWWAGPDKATAAAEGAGDEAVDVHSATSVLYSTSAWYFFFHGSVARLLLFFHLPVTVFSVFQLAHASSSPVVTVVFAAIVFVVFSLAIPVYLILRIRKTMTRYLQDDTDTLLSFGPLYNTFAQDSYTFGAVRFTANLIEGCVVGGAQNRATVQVSVLLAVEIVETLVTSIWLPWGEGAAQGPLQFILSVSRIITSVLLIVISPSVRLSYVARGWIGYVIILLQAVVVLMLLMVLLCKIAEVSLRLVWGVEFDESRSSKAGGIIGVMRKKDLFKRSKQRRRRPTRSNSSGLGKQGSSVQSTHAHRPQHLIASAHPALMRDSEVGYLAQPHMSPRPRLASNGEEDEEDFIMSPWKSRPASEVYGYGPGYVPPGAYSAPQAPSGATGFSVVRGGRATDDSPYTLADTILPAGAAPRPPPPHQASFTYQPPYDSAASVISSMPGSSRRARAASQSAIVENFSSEGETSPGAGSKRDPQFFFDTSGRDSRRMSAPLPASPSLGTATRARRPTSGSANPGWKRESSSGSAFFSNLFRGHSTSQEDEVDDWTDSDDSDDGLELKGSKRRWPFGKSRQRKMSSGALAMGDMQNEEDREEQQEALDQEAGQEPVPENGTYKSEPSSGKSFVVIRQPMPKAPLAGTHTST